MTEENQMVDLRESPFTRRICGEVVDVFNASTTLIATIVDAVEATTGDDMEADEMNLRFLTKDYVEFTLHSDGHVVELTAKHPKDERTFKITLWGLT